MAGDAGSVAGALTAAGTLTRAGTLTGTSTTAGTLNSNGVTVALRVKQRGQSSISPKLEGAALVLTWKPHDGQYR